MSEVPHGSRAERLAVAVLLPPLMPFTSLDGYEGVFSIVRGLCRVLIDEGHNVQVIVPSLDRVESDLCPVHTYPTFRPFTTFAHDLAKYRQLVDDLSSRLSNLLQDVDVCIVYDTVFFMDDLPLTEALSSVVNKLRCRLIHYSFECQGTPLAPLPQWSQLQEYPWSGIREAARRSTLAFPTESTWQRTRRITGLRLKHWHLLPPILDMSDHLGIDEHVSELFVRRDLWRSDLNVFLPGLNRANNNIEKAIGVVSRLAETGSAAHLLVTLSSHNWLEATEPYHAAVADLAHRLDLTAQIVFLTEEFDSWSGGLPKNALRSLYSLCDAVLLPTLAEGFGLVAVEASALGVPLVCSSLPVLREVTAGTATYIALDEDEAQIASKLMRIRRSSQVKARRAAFKYYQRGDLYARFLAPLLRPKV